MGDQIKYPAELLAAIVKVMGSVKKLGKSERNQFAKYNFAGIDKFLEEVNPLCVDAGLVIIQDEVSREVIVTEKTDDKGMTRKSNWLLMVFEFTLAHESGAVWPSPIRRSVMVPAEGAQAFGSGQSYALKQFQRSLFMIPTGEQDDADFRKATELPDETPRATAHSARKDGDYPQIEKELRACTSSEELRRWKHDNMDRVRKLPDTWVDHVNDEYQRLLGMLLSTERGLNGEHANGAVA